MNHKPTPKIIIPFDEKTFIDLQRHVKEIRRLYDWPGIPYHDKDEPQENRFNRWCWHNLPLLVKLHNDPKFVRLASLHFGRALKPSYAFLSLYGPEGVCPPHTDRPQCQFTIDLQIDSDGLWPIYIEDTAWTVHSGAAMAYSGTSQRHYRKPMKEDGLHCTFMSLAFFHFVPIEFQGPLS